VTDQRRYAPGWAGAPLAYREVGTGRPVVLLHGLLGTGRALLDLGLTRDLAEHGHRVILPDLRGHGDSPRSHDPGDYPPDVLVDDGLALVAALELTGYDLVGYSLGARVAVRMLVRGARPGSAVLGGVGLDGVRQISGRVSPQRAAFAALIEGRALPPGTPEAQLAHWVTSTGSDPAALNLLLDSLVPTPSAALAAITTRTLVVAGALDNPGNAEELAAAIPDAQFGTVPGDHYSAMAELGPAVTDFLAG
jgi:pimeloyl-ACP methyl ester carboxylesterase